MMTRTRRHVRLAAALSMAALLVPKAGGQSHGEVPAEWAQAVNVGVSAALLKKAAGAAEWDAAAVSTHALSMGDGYAELTAGVADVRRAIGLSRGDTDAGLADIDFALELGADGAVRIHEAGEARGVFGTYAAADRLRVAVELGAVVYRRNGALLYRSTVPPLYPLLVDTSFHTPGASLTNVVLSGSLERVAVSAPTVSVPGGAYAEPRNVVLAVEPPHAVIYYTTDGAEPKDTDPAVASGTTLLVDRSLTLRARAWAPALLPSRITTATYVIGGADPTPEPTSAPTSTPTPTPTTEAPAGGMAATSFAADSDPTEPPHPVMTIPGTGSNAEAILAAYTEVQFLELVPQQAPRHWDYGFGAAVVAGDTSWSWSAATPNQIRSMPSGTVFPNPAYPILFEAVPVLSGKTMMIPYHLAAGSTTRKSLPYAFIDYSKRSKLRSDMLQLAAAYVRSGADPATRDDRFARRIAVALGAWANYVPDYFMTGKNSPTFISAVGFTNLTSDIQRCSDHNGLAHEWTDDEILAFDAIYDSEALAELSVEKGYDVRAHIRANLFGNIGDFIAQRVPVSVAIATNLSGPFTTLAQVARVINRPDYMLWMEDYLDQTIRRKIMRDGVLPEGIGYSYGYITENLDASRQTRDYFLTRPADTPQLQGLHAKAIEYVSLLQFGQGQWNALRLPNGQLPSFGDTNFNGTTARNTGVSGLLPAYGHVALGAGTGSSSVQLNLNVSDDSNHMRADVTGFGLWANGAELLGNVRYFNGTPGRNWTEQILSHNAVTIDRVNMSRGTWGVGNNNHRFTSGNVTVFQGGTNGLHVVEVDGQRAYTNKATRYQRVMVMNTTDLARPYAVDVFRVTGGRTHDYTFHGSIRFDSTWESSVPLTPDPATYPMLEGTEVWTEPTSSGSSFPYYGFWREVSKGPASGDLQVTYRDPSASKRDLRLWMTDGGMADVYLGKTPTAERTNTEPPNFYKYWRPSLILRRRISTGTQESLFAGVVEPMKNGVSTIQSVQRVPLAASGMDAVALRITFADGRTDTVLVNLHNPRIAGAGTGSPVMATADGSYSLTGRVGAYSNGPAGERAWSLGAADFQYAGGGLSAPEQVLGGTVTGFLRKAAGAAGDIFVTTALLPEGTTLQGRWLSLRFETYRVVNSTTVQNGISEMYAIDRVERVGGDSHVHLVRDHKLALGEDGKLREVVAPERVFEGPFTFDIVRDVTAVPISPIADVHTPRNTPVTVSFTVGDLGSVPPEGLTVAASSSNVAVVAADGLALSGGGSAYTLTVTPAADVDGKATITVTATDGAAIVSRRFIVRVGNVNDPPTISSIGDRLVDVNGSTGPLAFTVGDPDTPLASLVVSAASSDPAVVPAEGISIGGSGASRTITVTPGAETSGSAVITVTVSDGTNSTATTFTVDVDAPPAISAVSDRTIGTSSTTGPIPFTVADRETAADALAVSAVSSNTTLVPAAGLVLGGTGADRTITVTPAAGQAGSAVITLRVSDGLHLVSRTFGLLVDVAPQIGAIASRTIPEDTTTGPIAFSVADKETPAGAITLTASSSNPALVPPANVVVDTTASPWTSADLGVPAAAGSSLAGETFTVRASGNDIWSTSDKGHFIYQPMDGDGEMVARVTSVQATDPWSKAGVMFRASPAANSPHCYMLLSATNGVSFQRRLTAGASSSSTGVTGITAPAWVRLVKAGNTFSAYYALDNAGIPGTWVAVGAPITINSTAWLRGLAATSHKDGTIAVSTYDNVSGPAVVGGNRTVSVTPGADGNGTATITLTANDGFNEVSRSFDLTVAPVSDPPSIGTTSDRAADEDKTVRIPLALGDPDAEDVLTVTAVASNAALIAPEGVVLEGEGRDKTLVVTPLANQHGASDITVTVSDGTTSVSDTFTLTIVPVNDVPTVSAPADVAIDEDGATGALAFTVADVESEAGTLEVIATSSNPDLVPAAGILIGGSGADRTVAVTPAGNANGAVTITLSASDGTHTGSATFVVTVNPVNDVPTITGIADQAVDEDTPTPALSFAVADVETAAGDLVVSATSSDTSVVAADGFTFAGEGGARTLVVRPAANASGSATITVTVTDGIASVSTTFAMTVAAVNDGPTVSAIDDTTVLVNEPITIPFTIGDVDHEAGALTVTVESSNKHIVRDKDMELGGAGADRTLTLTPKRHHHGQTTITVRVSDGEHTTVETFVLTVNFAPWISPLHDVRMRRGSRETIPFVVLDVETPPAGLLVTAVSSDPTVVPPEGLVLESLHHGFVRTLTIKPAAVGTADIIVTVYDGSDARSTELTVTVR